MLLGKEETVSRCTIDRIIVRRRCYEIEVNVEKTEVMRISMQPSPVQSMIDKIGLDDVEYVNILGRMTTKDVQVKLNLGLSWQSSIQQEEEGSFHQQIGLTFKK